MVHIVYWFNKNNELKGLVNYVKKTGGVLENAVTKTMFYLIIKRWNSVAFMYIWKYTIFKSPKSEKFNVLINH